MYDFSVLMSVYVKESPSFLRASLDSVFRQTSLPSEVILVEDGPLTTELYLIIDEYVKQYPVLKPVPLKKNGGLGNALNEGLKVCSYDIVARMDTDDVCVEDRFEKQLAFLNQHPEVDVVSAWIMEFYNETSNVVSYRKLPEQHSDIFKFGKKRNPINHPVVMFRKTAVERAGGYLPFHLFEDYYLWVRMLMNGSRFYNIQEPLLYFRSSPDMFKRRGGMKYLKSEISFVRTLKKIKYITLKQEIASIVSRSFVRLMPNSLRKLIYEYLIR